jgi:predicted Zn finger-like uncharacterized protein
MSITIQCPNCAARYQVDDATSGKRVRCKQCANVFTATGAEAAVPVAPLVSSDPFSPLGGLDLAQLPALPASPQQQAATNPAWNAGFPAQPSLASAFPSSFGRTENPSGGPTDMQMRLVCAGMLVFGLILAIGSMILLANTGTVYLAAGVLIPLMIVLGIAGLISPNVVRAVGKYGGHLEWHYKALGYGALVLSFALMILLMIGFFMIGFEPDRPGAAGGGGGRPSLTRSQTETVLERIRASHAASPNANVVRTVSFTVYLLNDPNPMRNAEGVLAPVPGYVPGSVGLSPDNKFLTFQYRGEKDMASQYAMLLVGPTGLNMDLQPEFKE